jgi:hypothetical protein
MRLTSCSGHPETKSIRTPSRRFTESRSMHFLRFSIRSRRGLVDLASRDNLELLRCRGALASALARWNSGDHAPARDVGGRDPVERIRQLMIQCQDELPPAEPELPFISEPDVRLGIEDRIHAAWTDFNAREWMGATVIAGAALEALLLWALRRANLTVKPKRPLIRPFCAWP